MLDRLKRAKTINKIIICTSTNPQDDPLEQVAEQEGIYCFRGSENDVLKRLLDAAKIHDLSYFANVTADCPLIDPSLVDCAVFEHLNNDTDLTMFDNSNHDLPFDCYILQTQVLERIVNNKNENDTEVWLNYFLSDNKIKINNIEVENKYHCSNLKLSIDYPEDYEFLKRVFSELYESNNYFTVLDIINLINEKPNILNINASPELLERWNKHIKSVTL